MKRLIYLLLCRAVCCFADPCIYDCTKSIDIECGVSGLTPIDCIYVINLDERPERWERLKPLLNEQGLEVHRFAAINGWKLSEEVKKKLNGPFKMRMCGGKYGCLLSHLSVLKDAYKRGFQIVWILEDDVEFLHPADEIVPKLLRELEGIDPEWDILYTDTDFRNNSGGHTKALAICPRPGQKVFPLPLFLRRPRVSKNLFRVRNRYGMTSYIVSARGLEKIYNYFNRCYIYTHFDIDIHYIPTLREYCPGRDYITNLRFGTSDNTITSELNR